MGAEGLVTRIFVTGASGLLGSSVVKKAAAENEVAATYFNRPITFNEVECLQLDLTDQEQYGRIAAFDPDVFVHCAAMTDVDQCERQPEKAHRYNVEMTKQLVDLAETLDARFVHLSTDAVFDGKQGRYSETDEPNPVNVYGQTKLAAERAVQQAQADSVVVRTNIYGWNATKGQSLAEWMLEKLRTGSKLPAFNDAYFSPIYTGDLALCLLELAFADVGGVIHLAGRERCSKLEFANTLSDVFGLDDELIVPTSVDEIEFDAPRGRDLSLSVTRAQECLDSPIPTVKAGLEQMKHDENE
jgi:dTDP-4-dehydrorhamnose reductase